MHTVLDQRTRYITTVVEDIFQPHNASAVLRSCDAFGIQDVHIIENRNRYHVNPGVELGTAQWLSLHRYTRAATPEPSYDQTRAAVAHLKRSGYRIVATSPHRDDVTLEQLDLDAGPVAIVFGSEKEGLSPTALDLADEYMRVPMAGFVESLNISVCAAITMHHLASTLKQSSIAWRLRDEERNVIIERWLRRSVKHSTRILERAEG